MSVLVVGVSHKKAPIELREKLAAAGAARAQELLAARKLGETVVLSTCNRFEIYAAAKDAGHKDVLEGIIAAMAELAGSPVAEFAYQHAGPAAVIHLFSVAAGLDSLVVGEAEILGQVKQSYEAAKSSNRTGKITNVLFQRALFVGKLVRSSTGIAIGQSSVASAAVALAERIFGNLRESTVLILGAGKMAELTAKHLLSGKVSKLYLANRTWENGVALAKQFQAEPVRWDDFPGLLSKVDIVISSTGASKPILTRDMVHAAAPLRRGRSLFIIDIAMPRDVDESVHAMDRVYLYTLENLSGIVQENLSRRETEITAALEIVRSKAADFAAWLASAAGGEQAAMRHSSRPAARRSPSPAK